MTSYSILPLCIGLFNFGVHIVVAMLLHTRVSLYWFPWHKKESLSPRKRIAIAVSSLSVIFVTYYILLSLYHPGEPLLRRAWKLFLESFVYYLLPIYPLDGGNICLGIAEWIRGKAIGPNILESLLFNTTVFLIILMFAD